LALIFAQYAKLEYWAIVEQILIQEVDGKRVARYRFSNLQRISDRTRHRNDLTVVSTGRLCQTNSFRPMCSLRPQLFLSS
jgi:hypothetical protein